MKKTLAFTMAAGIAASAAFAGNLVEPQMEPEIIVEEASSSSGGGMLVPILLLVLIAAAIGSGGSDPAPAVG